MLILEVSKVYTESGIFYDYFHVIEAFRLDVNLQFHRILYLFTFF